MTTVKDVLIYEALERNKQYKENKKKELSDRKVQVKIEKWKIASRERTKTLLSRDKSRIASWVKTSNLTKKVKKGILIGWRKKKNDTTLKKKKRIELLKRAKQVVYARDKNICQHCWVACNWSNRHASHIIPVSATGRLALYPLNMKVMCYHCHINWRHKNPIESGEWFANKFPDRLKELRALQLSIPMWSITLWELEEIEKIIEKEEKSLAIAK